MMKIVAAAKTGRCLEPRDFLRHGNIPNKPEKEKAEAQCSGLFGLLLEYPLNGCVPALPFFASSSNKRYAAQMEKPDVLNQKAGGLPSVVMRFKLTTTNHELKAQNNHEASHE